MNLCCLWGEIWARSRKGLSGEHCSKFTKNKKSCCNFFDIICTVQFRIRDGRLSLIRKFDLYPNSLFPRPHSHFGVDR